MLNFLQYDFFFSFFLFLTIYFYLFIDIIFSAEKLHTTFSFFYSPFFISFIKDALITFLLNTYPLSYPNYKLSPLSSHLFAAFFFFTLQFLQYQTLGTTYVYRTIPSSSFVSLKYRVYFFPLPSVCVNQVIKKTIEIFIMDTLNSQHPNSISRHLQVWWL